MLGLKLNHVSKRGPREKLRNVFVIDNRWNKCVSWDNDLWNNLIVIIWSYEVRLEPSLRHDQNQYLLAPWNWLNRDVEMVSDICNAPRWFNSSPLKKMTDMSQTIFWDAFSWMKNYVFWIKFHWKLFLRVELTITSIGLPHGLAPNRRQANIWTNGDPIHWRIYAALGGDEFNVKKLKLSGQPKYIKRWQE